MGERTFMDKQETQWNSLRKWRNGSKYCVLPELEPRKHNEGLSIG